MLVKTLGFSSILMLVACGEAVENSVAVEGDDPSQMALNTGDGPIEELIFSLRSWRTARVSPPVADGFCDSSGFPAVVDDFYDLYSHSNRMSDGVVVNYSTRVVGKIRTCMGFTSDPTLFNFFGAFTVGDVSARGNGECKLVKVNFPITGNHLWQCNLILTAPGYIGGHLTTNSIQGPSPVVDGDADAFGLHGPSFATVRMWRYH